MRARLAWFVAAFSICAAAGVAHADEVEVQVSPDGKKVQISGDVDKNDIEIEEKDGKITVKGKGTTKIKGPTEFPKPDELKIRLGDGEDQLKITGVTVKNLDIKDEEPDDNKIEFDRVHVGKLKVRLGAGNDEIVNTNDSDAGQVDVKTDGGTDKVQQVYTAPIGMLVPLGLGGAPVFVSYDSSTWCQYGDGGPYSFYSKVASGALEPRYAAPPPPAQCVETPAALETHEKEPNACRLEAAASFDAPF